MTTNCVNCGAPLTGHKCQYCGTEYKDHGVVASFKENDWTGTLTVGGKEYKVYLGSMEKHDLYGSDMEIIGYKHKFALIEM